MKTTVYLIRHGESEANKRDAFLGHLDLPLTETGRAQARLSRDHLLANAQRPSAIYASDLCRAYETAKCTADALGVEIRKDEKLREIDAGLWENTPFLTLAEKYPESYRIWREDIGRACPDGGESVLALWDRVIKEITEIAERHAGETVYIFSHGTPIRAFAAHCFGKKCEQLSSVPWPANASVTKAVYENGAFQMVDYNRYDFMGEIATVLPSTT